MLAEVTTTAISQNETPQTFDESRNIAKRGGGVARNARKDIEKEIGQGAVSSINAKDKTALEIKKSLK